MKNFPHQFNNLNKLYHALEIVQELVDGEIQLTDENFGEKLTLEGVYTYRNKSLSIEEFLEKELEKPSSNRGYLTVARDIRRLFELLGFLTVHPDKSAELSPGAIELLNAETEENKIVFWKNSFQQLGLEGTDGEISHPYRILLKLVKKFPGIETKKLMLCLEAENDSEEELKRVFELAELSVDEIIDETGTSKYMAANAVKILPAVADQLDDIERINHKAYPTSETIVTEDEIVTEEHDELAKIKYRSKSTVRSVTSEEIATDPTFSSGKSVNIDLADAINIRQQRLAEHQEVVRLLARLNEEANLELFEGKFDCLAVNRSKALLYEVKTILNNSSDQEKQTVKGVGQLKFYKYSIVYQEMGYEDIDEFLVFSQKPIKEICDFCLNEDIIVVWRNGDHFLFLDEENGDEEDFDPNIFL